MTRFSGGMLGVFAATAAFAAMGEAHAQSRTDEIVVTANRRDTALQQVPIAVTPVTAELIRNADIRDIQDLSLVVPALQFNVSENESSATGRIRGVGTQGSNPGLESAVGVFVDGVYRARNGVALTDLGELSQIEVLRGPQGTLFGRNTSAGLINVTTAAPDMTGFHYGGDATFGDYNEQRISGFITGPLIDNRLAYRLFAVSSKRDGFNDVVDPAGNRTDSNDRDLWSVRGQLLWTPTSDIDVRIIADASERDESCCTGVFYDPAVINGVVEAYDQSNPAIALAGLGAFGPQGIAGLGAPDFSDRTAFGNRPMLQDFSDGGLSAEVNWDTDLGTLTLISAYRDWSFDQAQDSDFSGADIIYRLQDDNGFDFEYFSQEARFAGKTGPLDWLVGLYYSDEQLRRRDAQRPGAQYGEYFTALNALLGNTVPQNVIDALASTEGGGSRDRYQQDGESFALFTHNIWSITPSTELSFGLRWTQEEKTLHQVISTVNPISVILPGATTPTSIFPIHNASLDGEATQSRDEDEWSGVIALRQQVTSNASAYLSYAHGYKGGGFNLDRDFDRDNSFPAETVDSWELGAKTTWLNGDLLLNAAIFDERFDNYQLNTFNGVSFLVASIPEAITQGFELDAIWNTPVEGLSMQGGFVYADAHYGDVAPGLLPNRQMTNAPLWTVTSAFTYERPVFGAYRGLAHLDVRYVTDQNTSSNLNPAKEQPSYTLVNARIGIATEDERYSVELWGRNLLDEDYAQIMFDGPDQFLAAPFSQTGLRGGFLGDPRTYGVTLRARF